MRIRGIPTAVLGTVNRIRQMLPEKCGCVPLEVNGESGASNGFEIVVLSEGGLLPVETQERIRELTPVGIATIRFQSYEPEEVEEEFGIEPCTLYLQFDPQLPDVSKCQVRANRGNVVLERLKSPSQIGSIFLPERAQETHFDGDLPVAGFEPSVCMVLASGKDCDEYGRLTGKNIPHVKGDLVVLRDGDGLCMEECSLGDYQATGEVIVTGWQHNENSAPGEMELMPHDESIVMRWSGERWVPTGKNVVIEVTPAEEADGLILLHSTTQTRPGEARVLDAGPDCIETQAGDEILYHILGEIDFYDHEYKYRRVIRESAVLAVISRQKVTA